MVSVQYWTPDRVVWVQLLVGGDQVVSLGEQTLYPESAVNLMMGESDPTMGYPQSDKHGCRPLGLMQTLPQLPKLSFENITILHMRRPSCFTVY